jgi:hypothetical protein
MRRIEAIIMPPKTDQSHLTLSPEEHAAVMERADVVISDRLAKMTRDDWRRVNAELDEAINRLPSSWQVIDRALDGITCDSKLGFRVMLSGAREDDGKLWMHLSMSRRRIVPNYEHLCEAKRIFLGAETLAVQLFPRESEHINIHRTCLHLWRCLDGDPTPDFSSGTGTI